MECISRPTIDSSIRLAVAIDKSMLSSSDVCPSTDDTSSEGLQTFMAELSRLEAVSQSRAQELAHARTVERELSEHLASVTLAAQKARQIRLQAELDAAAAQVGSEEARREAAVQRQGLDCFSSQLESLLARSTSLDAKKEIAQSFERQDTLHDGTVARMAAVFAATATSRSPSASENDWRLCRSMDCISKHPRLSKVLLAPLVEVFTKLGAQYITALGDTHSLDCSAPALHALWSLSAFKEWLCERVGGTLTDDDMLVLSFVANVMTNPVFKD
ncbi:hypothetical protein JKF63_04365 [Porcisia hertigi]|uniref:Uncharacterized protein n=1 Tax=Porcisia hertigi TaxID=2761500 RepID=A0A836LAP6_9TRYP|nr:hypothetical protein JKF63_04365 [Porcisia hertigi]